MLIKRISLLKRAIIKTKILRRGIHDSNVLAGETIRSCRNVIQMLLSLASEHINTLVRTINSHFDYCDEYDEVGNRTI